MTTTEERPAPATPAKPSRRGEISRWWNARTRAQQWGLLVPVAAIIYLLPVLNPPIITTEPATSFPIALFNAAVFALIAIGLNVVIGQAGLLDLGYVGFFAIGAYTAALLSSPDSELGVRFPWLVIVPIAMVVTMISGVILGTPTLRLRGDYLAIVTLGFGEIVRLLADNIDPLRGNRGFQDIARPGGTYSDGTPIFTQNDAQGFYWLAVTIVIIVLLFMGNLERSRVGRAWIAVREDEDAAELTGVPTYRFKIWAFAIGAAVGGLSGTLFAAQVGFVNNQRFDVTTSILYLAAVVLGGQGNKIGVVVGAFLVSYIPDRFQFEPEYRFLVFGLALIILMIFRPQGILGMRQHLLTYGRQAYQKLFGSGTGVAPTSLTPSSRPAGEPPEAVPDDRSGSRPQGGGE
ncbi:branched-chain amino acid ABC transporter permease [Actinomycetospora sp. NBRC 106378]|uniref:branched-chain amino acid ABC transporter permease n=1 Tax=Actinomycetospora sp. NBRC 106378 TaxID=3032208 RepID=UPI0024A57CB3|nr:branched-chain amino acid ABC transporter permease [Actinomycetospora sp. NBRC 106378]GLZ52103.1 high-affinity branched-chain amino acid ABC transporter [Actinomycetospora sp. NBRC 106378]